MNFPSNVWFPVVTLILGAVLKGVFDALTDGRARAREREARKEQRSDAIRLERVKFQRATLLDLQAMAAELARFSGRSFHEDYMAWKKEGRWRKQLLPEDINEGFRKAQAEIGLLHVRVHDEKVRKLADELSDVSARMAFSENENQATSMMQEMTKIYDELQRSAGQALRALDEDEDRLVK